MRAVELPILGVLHRIFWEIRCGGDRRICHILLAFLLVLPHLLWVQHTRCPIFCQCFPRLMSKMESPGNSRMPDAPTGGGPSSPPSEGAAQRRERSAIAAQACETCRSRKSRCDEKRPRCSLCTRLGVECRYREPMPTKYVRLSCGAWKPSKAKSKAYRKDRSITFMMQQLNRIDLKINAIGLQITPNNEMFADNGTPTTTPPRPTRETSTPTSVQSVENPFGSTDPAVLAITQPQLNRLPFEKGTSYQHLTTPHKILLWPAINEYLQKSGIDTTETARILRHEGTAWFLRLELKKYSESLPCDTTLFSRSVGNTHSLDGQRRVAFTSLNEDRMMRLTDSYFDSYNVLYPLIDRDDFEENVLSQVTEDGFGYGDFASVLCLMVFALGQIAYDGVWGQAIEVQDGRESGIRGGDASRPPGLELFNEARKRMGFILTQTTLENIQILQLTA
jgi:hypothetical protein